MPGLRKRYAPTELAANCIGDTDSELAFLLLLERLLPLEPAATPEQRFAVFREFCAEMREEGSANFLFSDGELLFVHAHRRRYFEDGAFGPSRPPGLHMRNLDPDEDAWATRGAHMEHAPENCVLIASVPLDRRKWTDLGEGSTLLVEHGRVRCSATA